MNDICWIGDTGLAIVMRPRGDDWLRDDLIRLQRAGVHTLVSTLEEHEALELGLCDEAPLSEDLGMQFVPFPITDRSTPGNREAFNNLVSNLSKRLQAGEKIGVHCRGCIGRSTVVTACTLVESGWTAKRALQAIEAARGCSVPDTKEQREWIIKFGAEH